jgi:hypothetical protein
VNDSPSPFSKSELNSAATNSESRARAGFELFLINLLILFLELMAIRWFPSHALHLTFFTSVVLLAAGRSISAHNLEGQL